MFKLPNHFFVNFPSHGRGTDQKWIWRKSAKSIFCNSRSRRHENDQKMDLAKNRQINFLQFSCQGGLATPKTTQKWIWQKTAKSIFAMSVPYVHFRCRPLAWSSQPYKFIHVYHNICWLKLCIFVHMLHIWYLNFCAPQWTNRAEHNPD